MACGIRLEMTGPERGFCANYMGLARTGESWISMQKFADMG